ncbi:MAG: glycosyltransferase [Nitriliruptorales bacterium]
MAQPTAKRVLLLAHRFPPSGGAGVQRNLQLARHLPEVGYQPIVVTGPGSVEYRWTPPDEALSDGRLQATIHRLPGPEPPHGSAREARLERWLRTPTRWQRWWSANVLRMADSVARDVDLVHASVAPYAGAAAALAVARRLRKPLVVDLEDPWALDEMLVYPSRWHRRLELRSMRRVLNAADAVVMNAPEARRRVLKTFPELSPERVVAIPNAFDPLDFAASVLPRDDGCFRVVHAGSLHTEFGLRHRSASRFRRLLGGAVPGVDFLTRSHVFLLEALASLLQQRRDLKPLVEVVLAGVFTDDDRVVASRYPFVQLHDFVPHAGTIDLMRSADLLFLPMHDLPAGRRAGIVPHKTYEYLASGRPILAAVPDGDARDLLTESGAALLCRPGDTAAMAGLLSSEIERWRSGGVPCSPRVDVVARCSSRRLVGDLGALYDAVAGRAASR